MVKSRSRRFQVNAICDVSGFKTKLHKLKKQWDGSLALPNFWDPRPQILEVPNVYDNLYVPNARPDREYGQDTFTTPTTDEVVASFLANQSQ
jgi:hypothetical protein